MTVPEPGWYVDPTDSAHLQWWDGTVWTEHRQANPQGVPVAGADNASSASTEAPVPMANHYGGASTSAPAEYVPMANHYQRATTALAPKLTRGEKDREVRRNNSFAYTGCVFALLGFLINPFAILSILGIIFSAIGLAKSHDLDGRHKVTGRGTAIAGIVLGLLGLVAFGWLLAQELV